MSDFFDFKRQRTEIQAKKKQRQEFKLLGTIRHGSGHILFSINTKTGEIKPVEYMQDDTISWEKAVNAYHGQGLSRKVQVEKDCVYIEALNQQNAIKKYRKRYGTESKI